MIEIWCFKCHRLMVEHFHADKNTYVCIECENRIFLWNNNDNIKPAEELCNTSGCKVKPIDL